MEPFDAPGLFPDVLAPGTLCKDALMNATFDSDESVIFDPYLFVLEQMM